VRCFPLQCTLGPKDVHRRMYKKYLLFCWPRGRVDNGQNAPGGPVSRRSFVFCHSQVPIESLSLPVQRCLRALATPARDAGVWVDLDANGNLATVQSHDNFLHAALSRKTDRTSRRLPTRSRSPRRHPAAPPRNPGPIFRDFSPDHGPVHPEAAPIDVNRRSASTLNIHTITIRLP